MTDRWIANVVLVVPAAHRTAAAALIAQVTRNPADAAPEALSVLLCDLTTLDVTHYAANTRARESALAKLQTLAPLIPGSLWHIVSHDDDTPEQRAARPTLETWLAGYGLRLQPQDDEE